MKVKQKTPELDAVQWSGSNWHQILEFAGRDRVHTEGAELHFKTEMGTDLVVTPGMWLYKSEKGTLGCGVDEWFKESYEPVEGDWPRAPE